MGSVAYLHGYLALATDDGFLPSEPADRAVIIDASLFERAVYDLYYALLHRRDDLRLPLQCLSRLLGVSEGQPSPQV